MKPILFAIWALLIPGAFLALGRIPAPCALLSSVTLVVLAWTQAKDLYARRIAVGMSFGLGGDLLMGGGVILAAMAVFAIGHFFYLRAMLGLERWRPVPWLLAVGLGAVIWYQLVLNGTGKVAGQPVIVYGGLAYTLFLASMTGVALGLAVTRLRYVALGLGGALFLVSDAVIAARVFSPEVFAGLPDFLRADLVWLTYAPAQLLIVSSAARARGTGIA